MAQDTRDAMGDQRELRTGSQTGQRALQILEDQHRRLASLLRDVRDGGATRRPGVVAKLMDQLDAHRRLEQEVFYPALRLHGGPGLAHHLASRAQEHRRLEELAQRLGAAVEAAQGLEEQAPVHSDGVRLEMDAGGPGGARSGAANSRGARGEDRPAATSGASGPGGLGGIPAKTGPAADLASDLAAALEQHIEAEEGQLFPLARQRLSGDLGRVADELVRGMEEFRFDYDDVVEGTFPASDPPATMAAPRVRPPRLYARSRKS